MSRRGAADKVILLTLVDLLLQLLFLFLFAVIVVSSTALTENEWKEWALIKEQIKKFKIDIPTFGPTWQQGQVAIIAEKAAKAAAQVKFDTDVVKPFNEPCIPPPKGPSEHLTRIYIAHFAIQDDGIAMQASVTPPTDSAKFREGRELFERQVKRAGTRLWSADEFKSTFQPFRDLSCEYYVSWSDKMVSNDKKKYQVLTRAIRFAFGPDRVR
jgi:hypothetical protein